MAVAALADALAAKGIPPSVMISELREELAESGLGERSWRAEEAAITRLELELCHGPPRDVCVKCRRAPREASMIGCGHTVLCAPCEQQVQQHIKARPGMSEVKLCRLLCPWRAYLEAILCVRSSLLALRPHHILSAIATIRIKINTIIENLILV